MKKVVSELEAKAYVDAFLEGGLKDWPANIQDGLLKGFEKRGNYEIVASGCDQDFHGMYFVWVRARLETTMQ